jgi:hypothetical protein
MSHLLCAGLGYSAKRIAARLTREGWRITGSSRTAAGCAEVRSLGYGGVLFEGLRPSSGLTEALETVTHLLVSAMPGAAGDPLLRWHSPDIRSAHNLRWIGYLSTVGVYGDHQGAWVDETTQVRPITERGRRRIDAEQAWLALSTNPTRSVQVFRLAGIYGPGQNQLEALRRGEARRIVKAGQVFNRIHVDDIATAVIAGLCRPELTGLFNVADDLPASSEEVITYAASLLGMQAPPAIPFETAELSPMARSFYGEVKRVSNARLKRELDWQPLYPTYREGLAALAKC